MLLGKVGSADGTVKIWDASSGLLLRTIYVRAEVRSLAFGRDVVREIRCAAFVMGQHARLGARSLVRWLEPGVVRMVVESM